MKYLLIILFISPVMLSAQLRKYAAVRVEKSTTDSTYIWYQMDYSAPSVTRMSLFSIMNHTRFTFMQDTVIMGRYMARNDGSIDSIFHMRKGRMMMSPKSQLGIPWSQVTSKPALDSVKAYTTGGLINQKIKFWLKEVPLTAGSAQAIDMSSAGFSTILSIQATAKKNSTSAPVVSIKSNTTTSVVVNVKEENAATVRVGQLDILSGLPLIFSTSTFSVFILVAGY